MKTAWNLDCDDAHEYRLSKNTLIDSSECRLKILLKME
jgi:hypothetical protein